jgi:maltose-binding protein MalE
VPLSTLTRRQFLGSLAAVAGAGIVTAGCGSAAVQTATQSVGTSAAAPTSAATTSSASVAASTASATSAAPTTATSSAAATSSAVATSSAAASSSPVAAKAGQVSLNWWPGWPGTYMGDIANAFMKDNPTIKVEPGLFYPDDTKLLAQVAAGTGPDLVSDIDYSNYIQRALVQPIDDLLQAAKIATKGGDIRDSNWNAFFWHGKYYGVPAVDTAGRQGIGYNVDLIQQAGLDPTKLPETWDDVYVWHQKLTKMDTAGNVQYLGLDPLFSRPSAASGGDPWMWPPMWGFHYFDVNTMKYDIDRSETADFYTMIQKFDDVPGIDKKNAFLKPFSNEYGAFGAGKQAMAITYPSGPAEVHSVDANSHYAWTYIPMPTNRKGITLQTAAGHAQVLLTGTKHRDEAFQLALYMTEKQACDILFDRVGWVGPSKTWQQTMDLSKFAPDVQQGIRFFTDSLDQAKEVWIPDMDPEDGYLRAQWQKIADQVNHHKLDAKTAAQQLQFMMTTQINSQAGDFKSS